MSILPIAERPVSQLRPYPRSAQTQSQKQFRQITDSIERFGFTNPVLVSDDGETIIARDWIAVSKSLKWLFLKM